eukprot:10846713-Lingulodinium_polyedra.AAC.1
MGLNGVETSAATATRTQLLTHVVKYCVLTAPSRRDPRQPQSELGPCSESPPRATARGTSVAYAHIGQIVVYCPGV